LGTLGTQRGERKNILTLQSETRRYNGNTKEVLNVKSADHGKMKEFVSLKLLIRGCMEGTKGDEKDHEGGGN